MEFSPNDRQWIGPFHFDFNRYLQTGIIGIRCYADPVSIENSNFCRYFISISVCNRHLDFFRVSVYERCFWERLGLRKTFSFVKVTIFVFFGATFGCLLPEYLAIKPFQVF